MKARLRDLVFDDHGRQILSLTLEDDFRSLWDTYKDKPLSVDVKIFRQKRSKNANDYLWELCTKIAENQGITKEEVYRHEIREVGVYASLTMDEKYLASFRKAWSDKGIGWFIEKADTGSVAGSSMVFAYYGSSTYDTKEMSRLIDNTVQDCKALGIETLSPAEIALMKEEWDGCQKHRAGQ